MADKDLIKQLQERVDFLEILVTSLVTKIEPSTNPAAAEAASSTSDSVQSTSATSNETPGREVPYLMRLPTELRMDICERVLQPLFYQANGLTPPLPFPVTFYTSRSRFPAVLQVNRTMRAESLEMYFQLAETRIAELEAGSKHFYDEIGAMQEQKRRTPGTRWHRDSVHDSECRLLGEAIKVHFQAMTDIDLACKALEGTFKQQRGSAARCCTCEK